MSTLVLTRKLVEVLNSIFDAKNDEYTEEVYVLLFRLTHQLLRHIEYYIPQLSNDQDLEEMWHQLTFNSQLLINSDGRGQLIGLLRNQKRFVTILRCHGIDVTEIKNKLINELNIIVKNYCRTYGDFAVDPVVRSRGEDYKMLDDILLSLSD